MNLRLYRCALLVVFLSNGAGFCRGAEANGALVADPRAALVECQPRGGLPNFFGKLRQGLPVRIAYLGGSITAQDGWRPMTRRWFEGQFPNTDVREINAAIGGTGSDLGVFRLHQDVLTHQPDLLFVEFAVNDAGAPPEQIYRCMEGIVRQAWTHDPLLDVCFVYTLAGNMLETYQSGQLPRSVTAMEQIAAHYQIPSLNFGLEVARLAKAGQLIFKGVRASGGRDAAPTNRIIFSPDAVHPYPETGHRLYLEAVVRGMRIIQAIGQPGRHEVRPAFVADHYEHARLVAVPRSALSTGWRRLEARTNQLARNFEKRLPELWKANQPGESLEFKFKGSVAGVYDLLGPDCGQVVIKLDDQPLKIRPRFDAFCTYHRLAMLMVANGLTDNVHTVRLEIHPEQPEKAKILAQRNEEMDDPKRFDDRAWYVGGILLVGQLVER